MNVFQLRPTLLWERILLMRQTCRDSKVAETVFGLVRNEEGSAVGSVASLA